MMQLDVMLHTWRVEAEGLEGPSLGLDSKIMFQKHKERVQMSCL